MRKPRTGFERLQVEIPITLRVRLKNWRHDNRMESETAAVIRLLEERLAQYEQKSGGYKMLDDPEKNGVCHSDEM